MQVDFVTVGAVSVAMGVAVALTYFGYSFVRRFASAVGALGGALLGSIAAGALVLPVTASDPLAHGPTLVPLIGALIGSIVGSRVARSAQRFVVVAACFVASASLAHAVVTRSNVPGPIPAIPLESGPIEPTAVTLLFAALGGLLAWRFYLPVLAAATSLFGASVLQWLLLRWNDLLPVLRPDAWTSLGTSRILWLLLVCSGIAFQYRRYRTLAGASGRVGRRNSESA